MKLLKNLFRKHNEVGSLTITAPLPGIIPHQTTAFFYLHKRSLQHLLLALFACSGLFYTAHVFMPKTVAAGAVPSTCFTNPTLLPQAMRVKNSSSFTATRTPTVAIGPFQLFSYRTCVVPTQSVHQATAQRVSLDLLGIGFLSKKITVQAAGAPQAQLTTDISRTVSAKSNLSFSLQFSDSLFAYTLRNDQTITACSIVQTTVICPLQELQLSQGTAHTLTLERQFKNEQKAVVSTLQVTTIEPVIITSSSLAPSQIVYSSPTEVTLTANKEIASTEKVVVARKNGEQLTELPTSTTHAGNVITVTLSEPLARNSEYVLTLPSVTGIDESSLQSAYTLTFTTSGGPQIVTTNLTPTKTSVTASIRLTFDVALQPNQTFEKFVSLLANEKAVGATVTAEGATITVTPKAPLPKCATLRLSVAGGLVNMYSIGEGAAWQATSRTLCQTVTAIGTSVQGRSINSYSFGTGATKVVYVGGTHGDEKSSVATLLAFIEDLEINPHYVPAGKTIIVIPNLNPDAYAASSRLNARGVDLNRNFPANNWQTDVYIPGNILKPGGGGTAPLSEPESAAIATFITNTQPRLVLTYHAVSSLVISNDAGDSFALAQVYANKSGFDALKNSDSHGVFEYDTTGEFEDWLHDKLNMPALLVELATTTSNEYNTQKQAMLAMAQL